MDRRSVRPRALQRDAHDLAALVIAVGLIGLVVLGTTGLPRILLAVGFAFFVPGRAVVANWPRLAYWSEFGVAVILSLSLLTLAATTALWAHAWHPIGLFEIEAGLCIVAILIGMARRHNLAPEQPVPRLESADVEDLS
jgi:uncharacterized membrane protein